MDQKSFLRPDTPPEVLGYLVSGRGAAGGAEEGAFACVGGVIVPVALLRATAPAALSKSSRGDAGAGQDEGALLRRAERLVADGVGAKQT